MKRICLLVSMTAVFGCGNRGHHYDLQPRAVVKPGTAIETPLAPPRIEGPRVAGVEAPVVEQPLIPVVKPKLKPPTIEEINAELQDAFFAYDRADPDATAMAALEFDARLLQTILRDFPNLRVIVEGHCDDRGSAEYNIGLGERRASRALEILRQFGLPPGATDVISYGKEAPLCQESTESCRARNRRAHLVARD